MGKSEFVAKTQFLYINKNRFFYKSTLTEKQIKVKDGNQVPPGIMKHAMFKFIFTLILLGCSYSLKFDFFIETKFLSQTPFIYSLFLCIPMSQTFDISNYDFC